MMQTTDGQWPNYSYVLPEIFTKARVRLVGLGAYVPKGIVTNEFFAHICRQLGTPRKAEDLERVTGLQTRHVRASTLKLCRELAGSDAPGLIDDPSAPRDELPIDMVEIAARRALASAGCEAREVDTIIAASCSDNDAYPTIAGLLQTRLECRPIRSTALKGACACQTEAFQVCAEILAAGSAKRVLLVSSEALLSHMVHILDWKTSSLFGEGAIAFLLERGDEETYLINGCDARQAQHLCYQTALRKDAIAMAEIDMKILQLYQEGRGEELNRLLSQYLVGYAKMNGKEVFREAPRAMAECVDVLCRHAHLSPDELKHIVPHQANSRITRRLGELLINDYGWPQTTMEKLADHARYYGNLSNASIGVALVEMLRLGQLQEGDWMALPAVGGGMNYGCWLLPFHEFRNPNAALDLT